MFVVVTEQDYVKRMPIDRFDAQGRGGKGIIGADVKEDDKISKVFLANTHDYLLCFTNHGQVYRLKTYEIPEMSRTARGKSAVNILDLERDEDITAVITTDEFEEDESLSMVTQQGYVKRTAAKDFENILSTGIIAARLEDGDKLVDVKVTDGTKDLLISTEERDDHPLRRNRGPRDGPQRPWRSRYPTGRRRRSRRDGRRERRRR